MTTNTETPPATPAGEDPAALKTEAAELQQDIKEAEKDAEQARKGGDDERATRLEASIAETRTELAGIKQLLEDIKGRPFHPAPGDSSAPPATPAGTDDKQGQDEAEPEGKRPKKKRRHFVFGDRWNDED